MEQNLTSTASETVNDRQLIPAEWIEALIDVSQSPLHDNDHKARGVIWVNHSLREYVCIPASMMDRASLKRVVRYLFVRTAWWSSTDDIIVSASFDIIGETLLLDYSPSSVLSAHQNHAEFSASSRRTPSVKTIRYAVQLLRNPPMAMEFSSDDAIVPQIIPLKNGLCLWRQCESDDDCY